MTSGSFDVAVIGGGVMGCAAARALAARRERVVLFERARIGHAQGSSHGRSRMIRLAYGHAAYIPLCRAAYAAWRQLEEESGDTLLTITGGLDLAFGEVPSWRATQAAMVQARVPHEMLDRDEIKRQFPQFSLPDGAQGLLQSEGGVLHADRGLAALASSARRHGAVLREGEDVLALTPSAQGIELQTLQGTYNVGRLVIAAGAATAAMLRRLGLDLPLTVSKEQVAFFRPEDPALHGPDRLPIFILHLGGVILSSGFPLLREEGLKLMIENKRPARDGDDGPDPELVTRLEAQVGRILPGLEPRALRVQTCRYTLTPDEDFIIDRHPEHEHIAIVSACSGHGFKFGALFGEAVADLAMHQKPAIDLHPFRIDRPSLSRSHNNRRRTS
ncbi:N-methyl-L-tryptophan oxidase [Taklimakanibacter deserti]|uniref:N-methyl-L-tryptophan oxidase n=1 Tax=Taklimakanibacter deserti TaxID=2267839 RepID=UPI0013C45834